MDALVGIMMGEEMASLLYGNVAVATKAFSRLDMQWGELSIMRYKPAGQIPNIRQKKSSSASENK